MTRNKNPVVASSICHLCGRKVVLFKRDAANYLADPSRGMTHLDCDAAAQADDQSFVTAQLPRVPGGDWGTDA